jgi:16S rRNA (uracil1498-N3)-methyltransferase
MVFAKIPSAPSDQGLCKMPRFFAEITRFPVAIIVGKGSVRHITGPLRKRTGDEIAIRVGTQGFQARISSIGSDEISVEIIDEEALQDRSPAIVHLAMCLFDLKDLEDALRSITELGVMSIYPVISSRSCIRTITEARYARWQVIIHEAVKQCDRKTIPIINRPVSLEAFIHESSHLWGTRLVAYKDAQQNIFGYRTGDVGILIGPEGGFSAEEIQMITRSGFIPVSLGDTTLRATTAAIAAVGILGI